MAGRLAQVSGELLLLSKAIDLGLQQLYPFPGVTLDQSIPCSL
jgi:hypothetical protein